MLQVPAAATVATVQDCQVSLPATSNRGGVYYSSSATVVKTGRRKLRVLEVIMFCFPQFSKVIETCEFDESSGTALLQVKGSLRRHVQFWRSIGALDISYQLFARRANSTWVYLPKY